MGDVGLRGLRIALAIAALIGVGAGVASELPRMLCSAAPHWIAVAVVLRGLAVATGGLRWGHVMSALGAPELRPARSIALSLEAQCLSLGLPTSVGGDAWRVYRARERVPLSVAMRAAFLDRAVGALVLLGIGAAARLAPAEREVTAAGTGLALALVACVTLRVRERGCGGAAADWAAAWAMASASSAALIGSHLAIARAIDLDVPAGVLLWVVPLILVARMIPLTPSGLGLGEATSALLLADYVAPDRAASFALIGLAAVLPIALLGGGLLLRGERREAL